jgi:16S rRNA (cytosine967-C5)-methyltransferase
MGPTRNITSGRRLAFDALERWERDGATAEAALEQACRGADPRERALALELTLGVLRWRSGLDDLLSRMLKQPLNRLHPAVLEVLRLGLYQLRHVTRTPARAVVHESVELCRQVDVPWATGLVNGVLRRYDRERAALEAVPAGKDPQALATRWAHPVWLVRQLHAVAGPELEAWLEADNAVPPLTLRTNTARTTREALMARLREAGHQVRETAYSPAGIVLESGGQVTALPGFEEGWFAVQDEASQVVGGVIGAGPGESILDACAAPGGKTTHLAALVGEGGRVYATDASRERLQQVVEAATRLVPGRVVVSVWDWTVPGGPGRREESSGMSGVSAIDPADLPALFDRALVDAPCSGFGIVRRKPEIKWRRMPDDVARYPARQLAILEAVAGRVRPGGTLVYSVCTPLPAEGPGVVEAFLSRHPEYRLVDLNERLEPGWRSLLTPRGYLRTSPHRHGCDAFFAARLERATTGDGSSA